MKSHLELYSEALGAARRFSHVVDRATRSWHALSLAERFLFGAACVLLPAMLVAGSWVTKMIRDGVIRNSVPPAALYLENFVEPLLQGLATSDALNDDERKALDRMLVDSSVSQRVTSVKIWLRGGRIAYSSRPSLVGQVFAIGPKQAAAWRGHVAAELSALSDEEHASERTLSIPLLETYFPVRQRGSERIIAVAEFYVDARELSAELRLARWQSWMMIGLVTLALLGSLYGIVRQGSRTIEGQRAALEERVHELTQLLDENQKLKQRVRSAAVRTVERNEFYLRRLGAELHDGPAQLISAALMRLPEPARVSGVGPDTLRAPLSVRAILEDALKALRNTAGGLAVPEIDALSLTNTILLVVRKHEALTATKVQTSIGDLPDYVPASIKLCVFRVVQEALTNAWRHAEAKHQRVAAWVDGRDVVLRISDSGMGFEWDDAMSKGRLGVRALVDRVESLDGTLEIDSTLGRGTVLTARLPLDEKVAAHA